MIDSTSLIPIPNLILTCYNLAPNKFCPLGLHIRFFLCKNCPLLVARLLCSKVSIFPLFLQLLCMIFIHVTSVLQKPFTWELRLDLLVYFVVGFDQKHVQVYGWVDVNKGVSPFTSIYLWVVLSLGKKIFLPDLLTAPSYINLNESAAVWQQWTKHASNY